MTNSSAHSIDSIRCLAAKLIRLFPPHQSCVEVFAGGAALFFMRSQPALIEELKVIG